MCTVNEAPLFRSVGPQSSSCLLITGTTLIEHRAGGPVFDWLSIDHVRPEPEPAGSKSLTVTPLACPAPLLLTVMVNPIGSPGFTNGASAVLLTWTSAPLTQV